MTVFDPTGDLHRAQHRRELRYAATYTLFLLTILVLVLFGGGQ